VRERERERAETLHSRNMNRNKLEGFCFFFFGESAWNASPKNEELKARRV
jgi:hypothetical protein